jgi:predicted acyl esterase
MPDDVTIVETFPNKIKEILNLWIPLKDGSRLAARMWIPADAEKNPVPAILEYIPYRKRDATAIRDSKLHPYFAGHGYAAVRVDLRGSGDSDGVLTDEYLKLEHDDALEVIEWLSKQPWCTGKVGMMGNSWGGFNSLQVAARRPPALKAIITSCSTDDRYADDIHYMGGCLLNDNMKWAANMFSHNSRPPDPDVAGNRWHEMWLERLKGSGLWIETWLSHQRRDAFWKHGSVCENYSDIQCAVFAVGGWNDGYSNAIPRLMQHLKCPRIAWIGQWSHQYPHDAAPGPSVAQGQGHRDDEGADGALLHPGLLAADLEAEDDGGTLGRRSVLAAAGHQDQAVDPQRQHLGREGRPSGRTLDPVAADAGPLRPLVPARTGPGHADRPARARRQRTLLRLRAVRRTHRASGRAGGRARHRLRQAERDDLRASRRHRAGRPRLAHHLPASQPHAPRQPRVS